MTFFLPEWAAIEFKIMISPINKIGFIFQLGYFKASGRFFKTETYSKEDFLFINRIYKCSPEDFDTFKLIYNKVDSHRHHQIILDLESNLLMKNKNRYFTKRQFGY